MSTLDKQYRQMWHEVLMIWSARKYQQPVFSPIPDVVRVYTQRLMEYLSVEYREGSHKLQHGTE